jgi:ABC-type dipeptide/oligopeptide/nickel transport system permease subunit
MFRTILPNCFAPIIVQMTVAAGYAVLLEAGLSFLGLGIKPPEASWGSMLNTGRAYLHRAPWYGIFPGLAITMLVLSLNFVADVLQQALDPTRRAL